MLVQHDGKRDDLFLLCCEPRFDIVLHGVRKAALISRTALRWSRTSCWRNRSPLFSRLDRSGVPIFVVRRFSEGDTIYVTHGYQAAQDS